MTPWSDQRHRPDRAATMMVPGAEHVASWDFDMRDGEGLSAILAREPVHAAAEADDPRCEWCGVPLGMPGMRLCVICDFRREAAQRLVLVLAHVRREKRRARKLHDADARLQSELDLARVRFTKDVQAALDRWRRRQGAS